MLVSSRPAPPLRHLVRYYYQVQTRLEGQGVLQPVPARSAQAIEFTFGTPYEVRRLDRGTIEQAHPVALIGAQTFRRVDLVMRGSVDAFTIVFRPGGLVTLFHLPGDVMTNDHFEGEAALGRPLAELQQRLGDVASFGDRVRVANECLASRQTGDALSATAKAAAEVLRCSGCVRVSQLASGAGVGIRQFERRFMFEVGIPPKLFARIVRFEAALRCKAAAPDTTWTDVAHALGYHDQMHMVHDFNQLSGGSPTSMASRLDMFVQPEVASRRRDSHPFFTATPSGLTGPPSGRRAPTPRL